MAEASIKASKLTVLGAILLLVGTSIGGAMLALPVATSLGGFWRSLILLFVAWLIMMVGALFMLEVNLWLDDRKNLLSMAKITLGPIGQYAMWFFYLLLFYTLLSGYISGGADMFRQILSLINIHLPIKLGALLFTLLFGFILFKGIATVDWFNRLLMTLKLVAYFILVLLLMPTVSPCRWQQGQFSLLLPAVMTVITSFGFAASVPTLRSYLKSNVKQLRFTIIIGSLIPLICYIVWDGVVQGNLSYQSLALAGQSSGPVSALTKSLSVIAGSRLINIFAHFFTSICVMTAFLGVGIAVTDFFADGFKVAKKNKAAALLVSLVTVLPPFLVVLFYPAIFLKAISFAGICCVILLVLLPSLMAWSGRYHKNIATIRLVPGGRPVVLAWIVISICLLVLAIVY